MLIGSDGLLIAPQIDKVHADWLPKLPPPKLPPPKLPRLSSRRLSSWRFLPLLATHCHSLPLIATHCHSLPLIALQIFQLLPSKRQTLFFTATWPREVQQLARSYLSPNAMQVSFRPRLGLDRV